MINVNSAVIVGLALITMAPTDTQQRAQGAVQLEGQPRRSYATPAST